MPDEAAAAVTPLAQVTLDKTAFQTARDELNDANIVVQNSGTTNALKSTLHTALAKVAGTLQNAETVAAAWIGAQGPTGPTGTKPPTSAVPTVAGISPNAAKAGTRVIISGKGFTGTGDVWFGTVKSTAWSVVSDTQISAVAPPSDHGLVDVTITNAHGTSAANPPHDQFSYPAPVGPTGPTGPTGAPTPPVSGQIVGLNDHSLMWVGATGYPVKSQPISQLAAVGAKVYRVDLGADITTKNTGAFGSAQCVAAVKALHDQLKTIDCQLDVVVTFGSFQPTPAMVTAMTALAAGCPGLWWEWGNELDYQAPSITPAEYVPQFTSIVAAVHKADPTAKISPAAPANIDPGGDGFKNVEAMFAAGLAKSGMDALAFHCYPWPTDGTPASAEQYIAPFLAQLKVWGWAGPAWLTECGWQDVDGTMTPEQQASYCEAWLASPVVKSLPVVIFYELFDDEPGSQGAQAYGWMKFAGTPKPVYTAFESSKL